MRTVMTSLVIFALAGPAIASSTLREVEIRTVSPAAPLPVDLTSPEGKTRWHLEALGSGSLRTVAIAQQDDRIVVDSRREGTLASQQVVYSGPDASRWLLPDRDSTQMKMGAKVTLHFRESRDRVVDEVTADVATIGIGWVHLPEGPEEVVLQRAYVSRTPGVDDRVIHRWVSPRKGVLAELSGPAEAGGKTRRAIVSIDTVTQVVSGAATLKVYSDQMYRALNLDIQYGWDVTTGSPPSAPVSSLVPNAGINNMCDLVNLSTWDFSHATSGKDNVDTDVASVPAESCNTGGCGYQGYPVTGGLHAPILERLDRDVTGTPRKDNQIIQREDRASDVTFWLRAGDQNEGVSGGFGSGETRFCFTDEASLPRNEVPVWQLPHNDAAGWYTQAGDTWTAAPVVSPACEQSFYNCVCGSCGGLFQTLYGRACTNGTNPAENYAGATFAKNVKGGVATLPSGHTFNVLVNRNTTEFCTYSNSSCSVLLATVRTIVYIFEAPYVGDVALLRGPQVTHYATGETGETPCTNFTTVAFTDIGYGLYPPVSITAGATTDTTASLSWNPGNDTHRIVGYKIYWDTDSGSSSSYAFNSVTNAAQVAFAGTSATISGLTPGTTYYFTVTSLSDYTDPSSGVLTHYESIKYPTTVSGDPNFSYPAEVTATTTGGGCTPTQAISGVTVNKALPNIHVCWTATPDACAVGYDVLGSSTASGGFGLVGQVGLTTCWDGNPPTAGSIVFLQVRARGTTGEGP